MSHPKKNKHGLSRDIPDPVAREIRKQCGFGCVICGCGIYQYEHIDPEFHDAKEHDPAKIALLCGGCHDKVTRKVWSKDKVREARANPRCLQAGHTRWDIDLGRTSPNVAFGDLVCLSPMEVLNIGGEQLLAIRPPEEEGAPVRLNGRFYDERGEETLVIQDNEILGGVLLALHGWAG